MIQLPGLSKVMTPAVLIQFNVYLKNRKSKFIVHKVTVRIVCRQSKLIEYYPMLPSFRCVSLAVSSAVL
jgi:hypothetical protein